MQRHEVNFALSPAAAVKFSAAAPFPRTSSSPTSTPNSPKVIGVPSPLRIGSKDDLKDRSSLAPMTLPVSVPVVELLDEEIFDYDEARAATSFAWPPSQEASMTDLPVASPARSAGASGKRAAARIDLSALKAAPSSAL